MVPHNPRLVKLNFDGSRNHYSLAGGFILCDWTGKVIKLGTINYGNTLSLIAEAWALNDGLRMAIQAGYNTICIEVDNLIVIQAFKGLHQVPLQIKSTIQDVHTWLNQRLRVTFNHVFREANVAADWLSKFGHMIIDTFTTDFCFSPLFWQILSDDQRLICFIIYPCRKKKHFTEIGVIDAIVS